jgi:riboflavin kinase/FMN adenylyltransferase
VQLLAETGIDAALVLRFDEELASLPARDFVERILVDALGARTVMVGLDFRFGKGGTGNPDLLRELGEELGFRVDVVDDVRSIDTDRRVSSTWIRELLAQGEVESAAKLLGRPASVWGEVVHGHKRGRELGFPTANLSTELEGFIPADGIYAGWLVDQAGTRWPAAISVGSNPTFDGVSRQVEAHVIDRPEESPDDFDLYDQTVVVEFVARLRGMVAYRGAEALVEQMRLDVVQAHDLLFAH